MTVETADVMAQVEVMLGEWALLEDIEAMVEESVLPVDEKAAVWLYAWVGRDRRHRAGDSEPPTVPGA